MDKGARLATGAVDGQRIADGGLNEEPVQHRAVVAVIIEAVDELWMAARLFSMRAPHDALMQISDPKAVILGIELEEQLIQALGHVVDRAGIGWIENLLGGSFAIHRLDADRQITFRDGGADRRIAIDAHGAEVDQMRIELQLDQSIQEIMRGADIVVNSVILVPVALHRVGRSALLGEMDDRIRPVFREPLLQELVVPSEVDQIEMNAAAGLGMPDAGALLNGVHRRQRLDTELGVDPAAGEIVEDVDVMPGIGEMQRGWPTDETVSTHHRNLHATGSSSVVFHRDN